MTNRQNFQRFTLEEKRAYLADMIRKMKSKNPSCTGRIQRYPKLTDDLANRYEPFPLTDIQESYLIGRQYVVKSDKVGCHIYAEFDVENLNLESLNRSWNQLIKVHELLRTVILKDGRQRIQKEIPQYNIQINEDRNPESTRARLSHKCYQAEKWPFFEVCVTHLNNRQSVIHFSIDGWLVDGASVVILLEQWYRLYHDPDYSVQETTVSFRDYTLAFKNFEESEQFKNALEYWKNKLKPLPLGFGPLKNTPFLGGEKRSCYLRTRLQGNLQPDLYQKFLHRARNLEVSPSALFLSLFTEVLSSHCAHQPFSIIMTFANRAPLDPHINTLIAPFISSNIFVNNHPQQLPFAEKVKQNYQQVLNDLDNSLISGPRVIRELKREGEIDPSLTIPVVFTSRLSSELGNSSASWFDSISYSITQTPQVYLDHQVLEKNNELIFFWDVAEEVFPADFIKKLFNDFNDALRTYVAQGTFRLPQNSKKGPFKWFTTRDSPRDKPFPLSDLQQAHLMNRMIPQSGGIRNNLAYQEFEVSNFDLTKMNYAYRKVVEMNDMLRATIKSNATQSIVGDPAKLDIEVHDLRDDDHKEKESRLVNIRQTMLATSFQLGQYPFHKVSVSLVEGELARIHFIVDMLIIDGDSLQLLFSQLLSVYENPEFPGRKPSIVFQDYIESLAAFKQSQEKAESIVYFEQKLKKILPGPELPVLSIIKEISPDDYRRIENCLSNWKGIKEKATVLSLSTGSVLLTAFLEVLSAWSKKECFTITAVDFDRLPVHREINQVMGDFTSVNWITTENEPGSFVEKLKVIDAQWKEELSHRPASGLEVFRNRNFKADNNPNLSFPVVFTNLPRQSVPVKSGSFTKGWGISITSQVQLDVIHYESDSTLIYCFDYILPFFAEGLIEEIFNGYSRLLDYLAEPSSDWDIKNLADIIQACPQRYLTNSSNSIIDKKKKEEAADSTAKTVFLDHRDLSESERNKILYEWNDTAADYNRDIGIHRLFEKQAELEPNRVATLFQGSERTYSSLNKSANQLARLLREKGLGQSDLVGVCLDRSHDMIVCVLAILKSGGAYVPLDVTYPQDRLELIVRDSNMKCIVSFDKYSEFLNFEGSEVVCLDTQQDKIQSQHQDNLELEEDSGATAYVIFTSGSTGKPKGVAVSHKPVINLIEWMAKQFAFCPDDCVLFTTSLGFDLSVFDIFGMLAYGGRIHIVPDTKRNDFKYLAEMLCNEDITFWNSAPAVMHMLVPFLNRIKRPFKNNYLRLVFLSGDWIPLSLPDDLVNIFPKAEVISLGGATEATVWSNYYPIKKIDPNWKSIPYGRPIQNAKYYILNGNMGVCPVGVKGDLYIGGECLSQGYYNAPEITVKRFVSNPFADDPKERLYKTGDLARFFPDGNIEFLGRADFQVKIRGFRIELGEIENRILKHEHVKDVIVEVKTDEFAEQKLVSYIIPHQGKAPTTRTIREFCAKFLPDYMLPNAVVSIKSFPITANGKVDRQSLPHPGDEQQPSIAGNSAFGEENNNDTIARLTIYLTDLFRDLMKKQTIEQDQDLFNLGATSLTIVNATQRILLDQELEVPVEAILEKPTIQSIVQYMATAQPTEENPVAKKLDSIDFKESLNTLDLHSVFEKNSNRAKDTVLFTHDQAQDRLAESKSQFMGGHISRSDRNDTSTNFVEEPFKIFDFLSREITFELFGKFLSLLKSKTTSVGTKYLYPSAGGLYAVQSYIYVKENAIQGLAEGVYYYHPTLHTLYPITLDCRINESAFPENQRRLYRKAGFCMFFFAQLNAVKPIYSIASDALVTLDTGYLIQLLSRYQSDYDINTSSMIGVNVDSIVNFFKLDIGHRFIHCLAGGFCDYKSFPYHRQYHEMEKSGERISKEFLESKIWPDLLSSEGSTKRGTFNFLSEEEHKKHHEKKLHLRRFEKNLTGIRLIAENIPERRYFLRSTNRNFQGGIITDDPFYLFLSLLSEQIADDKSFYHHKMLIPGRALKIGLHVKANTVEGLQEGFYLYHSNNGTLSFINRGEGVDVALSHYPGNRNYYHQADFSLFLIADLQNLKSHFASKAINIAMLNAGHIGQLLMDRQAEFGIGLCPIGGMNFERISDCLGLGPNHMLLHSFLGGKVEHPFNFGMADETAADSQDIAIIGISARFPGADNLDQFWSNLVQRKSFIRETSWDDQPILSTSKNNTAATGNWGAMLSDSNQFDSLFFHISPAEAQNIDPQERLFMEVAWECMEDAAYTSDSLVESAGKVGVYVGSMWNDYQNVGLDDWDANGSARASAFQSSIANRVSYFHNFQGPSLTVDTSCSSALTAIHLAIGSIKAGECNAAIVGGVNVVGHSYHQNLLRDLNLLSNEPASLAFDEKGSGWVVGEGCCAILIRPLAQAFRNNDHIYGVIKGSFIRHLGKSTRYGAPCLEAQTNGILEILDKTGITADEVCHVESAATGASIADATEVNALVKAFRMRTTKQFKCSIGSVKPNIGHLESASAMSQLAKILLQFRYDTIAPTILNGALNPLMEMEGSPFFIPQEAAEWPNGQEQAGKPLKALINAYGATGSCGHLLLESYVENRERQKEEELPTLILLSVTNQDQLKEYARKLLSYIGSIAELNPQSRLTDVAFTLAVGRQHMNSRLCIITNSIADLIKKLKALVETDEEIEDVYYSHTKNKRQVESESTSKDCLSQIALNWVNGANLKWRDHFQGDFKRVPLPTYPFKKVSHYLSVHHVDRTRKCVPKEFYPTPGNKNPENAASKFEQLTNYLASIFSQESMIPLPGIDTRTPLEYYGINSLLIEKLNARLAKDLGNIPKTIFFQCPTISNIANLLLEEYSEILPVLPTSLSESNNKLSDTSKVSNKDKVFISGESRIEGDMAIIGVAGQYPQAEDLDEFWQNIKNGQDCITEYPVERCFFHQDFGQDKLKPADAISRKMGGYISGVNMFDPLFFNISPRDARIMDPQERLFLKIAWRAFEDAGYNRSALKNAYQGEVGVFVGVMYGEYQFLGVEESLNGNSVASGSAYGSIANRVSYFYDFNGPSMAVDTLCSSSITGLCLAISAIRAGECKAALVGGTNISIHPNKFIGLSQLNMSSIQGKCKSFGEGGDGFVPGEGIGAIMIKPLDDAEKDGDRIQAVIKSAVMNHNGKTYAFTVPNPKKQSELIARALKTAGIHPETISYIEAHGTGTALGDPIEIEGLKQAFAVYTKNTQFCAIGSVKPNIGHLESAAGIAGITKIILQMKHKQLVPSLHSSRPNPNIDFDPTPFFVQQQLSEWHHPMIQLNGTTKSYPRRAGISSFGAGGSNAHVILEEYQKLQKDQVKNQPDHPLLFIMSARDKDCTNQYVRKIIDFLQVWDHTSEAVSEELTLRDLAYTLQVGREPLIERLAIIAISKQELIASLQRVLQGEQDQTRIFRGKVEDPIRLSHVADPKIKEGVDRHEIAKLAKAWCGGKEIRWGEFYQSTMPKRISMPGVPFAEKHYWLKLQKSESPRHLLLQQMKPTRHLHGVETFTITLQQNERMIQDHQVNNLCLFPGVAYLEMAMQGLKRISGSESFNVENIIWVKGLILDQASKLLRLDFTKTDRGWNYKFLDQEENQSNVLSEGRITSLSQDNAQSRKPIDLNTLKQRCVVHETDPKRIYRRFEQYGIRYGLYFQCLKRIWKGDREVLGLLELSDDSQMMYQHYQAHPALMDGALQTLGFIIDGNKPMVPFSIGSIKVLQSIPKRCYAHVKAREFPVFDIQIMDESGVLFVEMKDVSLRESKLKISQPETDENGTREMIFIPLWKPTPISGQSNTTVNRKVCAIYSQDGKQFAEALLTAHEKDECLKIKLGTETTTFEGDQLEIDTFDPEAWEQTIHRLQNTEIIYFLGGFTTKSFELDNLETLNRFQEFGVLSLFRLIKAYQKAGLTRKSLILKVITNNAHKVFPDERIVPYSASVLGLAKTIAKEYPKIALSSLDLAWENPKENSHQDSLTGIIEAILREPAHKQDEEVALRSDKRYSRILVPAELPKRLQTSLRSDGVYVIVGGAGGVGLELSKYLTENTGSNLALLGRRPFAENLKKAIEDLTQDSRKVRYYQADVTIPMQLAEAIAQVKTDFGKIDGIIHAAVDLKDNTLERMSEEEFQLGMAPKVKGSICLFQLLRNEHLEFLMFFSSVQSFSGRIGVGNYTAGCLFEDAVAEYINQISETPCRVINWGYWGKVGTGAIAGLYEKFKAHGVLPLSCEDAMKALNLSLQHSFVQLVPLKAEKKALELMGIDTSEWVRISDNETPTVMSALSDNNRLFGNRDSDISESTSLAKYMQGFEKMEYLTHLLLLDVFRKMGIFNKPDETSAIDRLRERLRIKPDYEKLFQSLLSILKEAKFVELKGGHVFGSDLLGDETIKRDLTLLDCLKEQMRKEYPEISPNIDLLGRCLKNLQEVLTGEKNQLDVLFPGGSSELVEKIYNGNCIVNYYNKILADIVQNIVREQLKPNNNKIVNILEIGAGTGGSSLLVLEVLREFSNHINYYFTDISPTFVQNGKKRFEDEYPFSDFQVLDMEHDPREQGFQANSIDIIFATNVLHATKRIDLTLKRIKTLLKTNGVLIINEVTKPQASTTVTFGLTKGWWVFEDAGNRISNSPLLSVKQWQNILGATGYRNTIVKGMEINQQSNDGQHIIISESDGLLGVMAPKTKQAEPEQVPDQNQLRTSDYRQQRPLSSISSKNVGFRDKNNPAYLEEYSEKIVRDVFSSVLELEADEFESNWTFENYGVDSITTLKIIERFEEIFGKLSPTLLFEYMTIQKLVGYFCSQHAEKLRKMHDQATFKAGVLADPQVIESNRYSSKKKTDDDLTDRKAENRISRDDIAIIGLSGRYPKASNLDQFWFSLKNGVDSVTEVPKERWNCDQYYDPDPAKAKEGKIYCKWGGFLDDVDMFDSLFFNISPREAEIVDPQERLFLETAWAAIEDAGYTRGSLIDRYHKAGGADIGVYVGVTSNTYMMLGPEEWRHGNHVVPTSFPWSIANRVSYYFNFQGPSFSVDTACSASLTAIHLACTSIRNNETSMALAGGVNLYCHPSKFQTMCDSRMLSQSGKCRSFGEGADGIVPGEGVGALLLKKHQDAVADGDNIHAIIKGSSINSGGKTSGYTVPNPNAQSSLISETLKRFSIDPETISYIEAHGTGTSLGDPIEFTSLTQVFKNGENHKDRFCALGSVKSNIGHLESAAGIAGITKVILQMKHKSLVPSLHSQTINSKIDIDDSPFYISDQLMPWDRLQREENGLAKPVSRRAGICSFGAGGANAFLVLEEPNAASATKSGRTWPGPFVFVLSAKNKNRLRIYADKMLEYLSKLNLSLAGNQFKKSAKCQEIQDELVSILSEILTIEEEAIDCEEQITSLTQEPYHLNKFISLVNDRFNCRLDSLTLAEHQSVSSMASFLQGAKQDSFKCVELADVFYTLQIGRDSMEERLACVVNDMQELVEKLQSYCHGKESIAGFYQKNIQETNKADKSFELTEGSVFSENPPNLDNLAEWWVNGQSIDWSSLYIEALPKRISLPTYPFEKESHWIDANRRRSKLQSKQRAEVQTVFNDGLKSHANRKREGGIKLKSCGNETENIGISPIESTVGSFSATSRSTTGQKVFTKERLKDLLAGVLYLKYEDIDDRKSFVELGLDSILSVEFANGISKSFGFELKATTLYDFPSVTSLTDYLEPLCDDGRVDDLISLSTAEPDLIVEKDKPQGETPPLQPFIKDCLARVLYLKPSQIDESKPFMELGLDSILSVEFVNKLGRELGLRIEAAVLYDYPNVSELTSYINRLSSVTDIPSKKQLLEPESQAIPITDPNDAKDKISLLQIKGLLSEVLYLNPDKISDSQSFSDLGLDSILSVEFVNKISREVIVDIQSTTLYDYPDLVQLTRFLNSIIDSEHPERAIKNTAEIRGQSVSETETQPKNDDIKSIVERNRVEQLQTANLRKSVKLKGKKSFKNDELRLNHSHKQVLKKVSKFSDQKSAILLPEDQKHLPEKLSSRGISDIAIIGISARLPQAESVVEFWENLEQGRDCVSEIPRERWDKDLYFDPDPSKASKTYSKWGGFLDGIDQFDPLFFNISPLEAELMDPHQRLFLQEAWKCFEDAGYADDFLNNCKCGVYVGVISGSEYPAHLFGANSILASRISYFLNLRGPALAIDTACSSSLVAMHLACQQLILQEADMMLVGGITLYLTEKPYIRMSQANMLASDGKCKVFDSKANGFVPGEGVAVLLLKPYSKALEDKDLVYGIIKGSAINQDGKTNGITAPSGKSQTELESEVYQKANIDPNTIDYVEAHGTGTKLGDPIELSALAKAFSAEKQKKQFCAIGSVKSNIGHTTAAAGIAGVIKVLLAFKHRTIPPSLHFEQENEQFEFKQSPFFVNSSAIPWKSRNDRLRAAVSSFGYNGTNAHVVLEYLQPVQAESESISLPWYLIPLSAKTELSLKTKIDGLLHWLDQEKTVHIGHIAYTLGKGRSHFPFRVVLIVRDCDGLKSSLLDMASGSNHFQAVVQEPAGEIADEFSLKNSDSSKLIADLNLHSTNNQEQYRKKLNQLADGYLKGKELDWEKLYAGTYFRIISLPTYPFVREHYWLEDESTSTTLLTEKNASMPSTNSFIKRITGDEFYLRDHIVHNQKLLPASAFLEIVRSAAETIGKAKVEKIRDVTWMYPLNVNSVPVEVQVRFSENLKKGSFLVESSDPDLDSIIHSRGQVCYKKDYESDKQKEMMDLEAIRNKCFDIQAGSEFYRQFQKSEFYYGPSFKCVKETICNRNEVLSVLDLPEICKDRFDDYVLHPSLLDGAFQTVTRVINENGANKNKPYVPFALDELEILNSTPACCFVYASRRGGKEKNPEVHKFDLNIMDTTGLITVKLKGFTLKKLQWEVLGRQLIQEEGDRKIKDLLVQLKDGKLATTEVNEVLETLL